MAKGLGMSLDVAGTGTGITTGVGINMAGTGTSITTNTHPAYKL